MKKLLPVIIFMLLVNTAFSSYSTPGTGKRWNLDSLVANSGGVVTFSSGSYIFNSTVQISLTDTLMITNNALLKFTVDDTLNVYGVLKVMPPDSVKMTALDTAQKFRGIILQDQSDGSVIKKLILEYAYAIKVFDSHPVIDSCTIRFNAASTSYGSGAINLFRSNAVITNCRIYRNQRAAIVGGGNIANSPQIINNLIYENGTENGNYPQINLGSTSPSLPLVIRGNTITGMFIMAGGIAIFPVGSAPNVIIENNIIKKNRYGITIQGANVGAYVNNNVIDSNNIQGLPNLGGSGINVVSNQTSIFTRNIIRGNLWGVTVQGTGRPNLGDLTSSDTTDVGLNQIYNNGNTGQTYDLFNNTTNNMKAENNYWGTTNLDSVEAHISHDADDTALGVVDYTPIWTLTGIVEEVSSIPSEFALYNAYPNPFNPATTIKFGLPEAADAKLIIYDNLGREAAVILNRRLNAGIHQIQWNASGFTSGIYYYRLITPGFSAVKKIMLVK